VSGTLYDPPDHGTVEDEWEEPTPLRAAVDLPPFPVEALPDFLAAWVRAEATATQTPPDLAGMLVLATLATAAGGLARIQIRPGWQEPLNLFVVVALPPGSRKTAVFADVTRPLVRLDRDELARSWWRR
jgi:replicative DNA helicase